MGQPQYDRGGVFSDNSSDRSFLMFALKMFPEGKSSGEGGNYTLYIRVLTNCPEKVLGGIHAVAKFAAQGEI